MAQTKKRIPDLPLSTLLQEVKRKMNAEELSMDQQQSMLSLVTDMLQVCGKTVSRPLPGEDMQEVRGQNHVKRALEVAAAGGHHILLIGPPAVGKRLLARTLPSILPMAAGLSLFRAPDPSIDVTTFTGDALFPGELSLAHGGVLFLEDLGDWPSELFTPLRHTMETQSVTHANGDAFPAHFLLIATMTPCPCGFFNDPIRACHCSAEEIIEYLKRIQKVIECFEIYIEVPRPKEADLLSRLREESSEGIRQRVERARAQQHRRYADNPSLWFNADLGSIDAVQQYCILANPAAEKIFKTALHQLQFTPRQVMTTQKVARTIADLGNVEQIEANAIAEAIQYRPRS